MRASITQRKDGSSMATWTQGGVLKALGKREPRRERVEAEEVVTQPSDTTGQQSEEPRWRARKWRLKTPERIDVRFAR